MIELDPTKTLLSIDGIGAFDHIKLRMFYGKDSTFVWYDDEGIPHDMRGGEQGDRRRCMPWANMQLSSKFRPPSALERCCSRIWTTSTSSATLLALQTSSSR